MFTMSRKWLPAAFAAAALFIPATSHAIPAWEHASGTPCNACHFGASNRLTKMGFDFLSRGHRLPGEQGVTTENVSDINMLHYVSLPARGNFNVRQGSSTANPANSTPSTNFSNGTFEIYAGGPLVQKLSFFATDTLSSGSLGDAEVQYTSDLEKKDYWWARAGQFSPHIAWIAGIVPGGFAAPAGRSIGAGNPQSLTTTNRGASFGIDHETGLGTLRGELGIVNGGATGSDTNNYKDQYVSLSQELDPYSSQVGVYFYNGRNRNTTASLLQGTPPKPTTQPAFTEKFNTVGLLGQFIRDTYEVHGAYLWSRTDNPPALGGRRKPTGYYLEGDYNLNPNGTAFLRYDRENDKTPTLLVSPVTGARNWTLGYYWRYHDFSRFGITGSDNKNSGTGGTHTKTLSFSWSFYL